jgi:hypothetical protein
MSRIRESAAQVLPYVLLGLGIAGYAAIVIGQRWP